MELDFNIYIYISKILSPLKILIIQYIHIYFHNWIDFQCNLQYFIASKFCEIVGDTRNIIFSFSPS